ncbi:MAG: EVE domain-containing protein [Gammaproteobacteria bacterium]|nr:EVE domain-containing protein [Gammaproteobacteria bacterium]
MSEQRFWIGTVSKEHVLLGKAGGFAQVCHGKQLPLKRMSKGDILIYYSPSYRYGDKSPYQCFTALGVILENSVYQVEMTPDFAPYRRNVRYLQTADASIKPLISQLHFIQNKDKWGYAFRFGILSISCADFMTIAHSMQLESHQINELLI